MKALIFTLIAFLLFFPISATAQLTNGGISAYFGVDGDTRNNYAKYGPATGSILSDDWFSGTSLSNNVIDTSNASFYLSLFQGGANMGFNKRMSVPLYSKLNGKLWLDAVYGRDYVATGPFTDLTAFTIACKNGADPSNWVGGSTNFPDKNDLVDVFAHMRRDGISVYDSLWFFAGVSTVGTSGSRYFDIELYKNNFSYNGSTGVFSSAGTNAGHTQWVFDASGNIIQTGDMIVAVNFSPGSAPVVDLRIWVSQSTYTSVVPAYFNFGPNFDGATAAFGYASILSKTGATNFGSGIANYSATAAQDTTFSTPWGTEQSNKTWDFQYQTLQLVEIGLNLTRIGVDPALYTATGLSPCESLFSNIFFKSRSSNSFVSNLQDFVEPLQFLRNPVMDYTLRPDTLRCNHTAGTIQIANNSTAANYSWQTSNGNITGSNSDSSQINLNKPGTYIISASPAVGCPVSRIDTIKIPIDTFPPVASIFVGIGPGMGHLQFFGGDLVASNYMTPFGGSQGLLWDWSGPASFTSSIQNPINDTAWGTYQLIVTEKRNGCKDTAQHVVSAVEFGVLAQRYLKLAGDFEQQTIRLHWQYLSDSSVSHYEIQKSAFTTGFETIGNLSNQEINIRYFGFTDVNPFSGDNFYRIKCVRTDGQTFYSNIIKINGQSNGGLRIYLIQGIAEDNRVSLAVNSDKTCKGKIAIHNSSGQLLEIIPLNVKTGLNIVQIERPKAQRNEMLVVSVYINERRAFSQTALFKN